MPELRLTVEQKSLTRLQHPVSHPGLMSDAEELSLVVMMWRLKVRSADDLHKAAKSVLGDFGARVSHKEAKIQAVKSPEPCSTVAHEIALLEEPRRSIPMLPRPQVLDAAGEFGETAVFRNVYASSLQPVTERHDCPEDLRPGRCYSILWTFNISRNGLRSRFGLHCRRVSEAQRFLASTLP